ncbi:L-glutamine transmembrane transporter [Malassezia pachydermatis]|uniref:Amino acid transport protein n=1 Tax=Malassezia pachydermatis TaxID=77020 RepID=A0A0M8MTV9_9BASI|nr:amino acid transport protein [Malassezia pachydermatis]KOS13501.1 amino acid transport protein [Malassezia pachydermatis]
MPGRHAIPMRGPTAPNRAQGRDNAVNQPWRSSLDLVWSYSRSQAYFGDNLISSPSFVERRWCGQDPGTSNDEESVQDSDAQMTGIESTDGEFSGDNSSMSDDSASLSARVRDRGPTELEAQQVWDDMQEAEMAAEHRGSSSRRGEKSHRYHHTLPAHAESDDDDDEDDDEYAEGLSDDGQDHSGRSRSRSPKQLSLDATATKYPQRLYYASPDRAPSRPPRGTPPFQPSTRSRSRLRTPLRASAPHLRDPYRVDERTPLMRVPHVNSSYQGALSPSMLSPATETALDDREKSTTLQTWFNTVNALVGVGILSMPLVFASAGWMGGFFLFILCGSLTNWSGKLLARIMARDPSLRTYADIGMYAFGPKARVWIGVLFCMEMFMVAVALIILFSDSLAALVYGYAETPSPTTLVWFKALAFVLAMPTLFLSLSLISPVSLIGILSILFLFLVLFVDGLAKREAPGSLWHPASTTWKPQWSGMGIGFGLLMSGFSSHPIIPSLYRDMRNPADFCRMLDLAYVATALLYLSVATTGYMMFGDRVSDVISSDLAHTPGMPAILTTTCVLLMTINPLTKFALAVRPVQSLLENLVGLSAEDDQKTPHVSETDSRMPGAQVGTSAIPPSESTSHSMFQSHLELDRMTSADLVQSFGDRLGHHIKSKVGARLGRIGLALILSGSVLFVAIVFPSLERVMAFLGAFFAFNTCILGPFAANMAVFATERSMAATLFDCILLGVSLVLSVLGTLGAFTSSV